MIIIRLNGALGNQMFQYAMGRAVSLRNHTNLKIDIATSIDPKDTQRPYVLKYFNIFEDFASESEIRKLKYPFGIFSKISRLIQKKIFRRFHKGFDGRILHIKDNTYVDGFWQSYKYFEDVAYDIRKDFTLKDVLSDQAQKIVNAMKQVHGVSVHVRRGDYVSNPVTHAYHGVCSLEYYQRAIAYMQAHVVNPVFFVFSDDVTWAKAHLSFGDAKVLFVSDYKLPDYEELVLMSNCNHHIIANSSFSWWGAWLNPRVDKIVIAPKKWFAKGNNPKDLLPPSWIQM